MTDLLIWGGPVYCTTPKKVEWKRPTAISCRPLDGAANGAYYSELAAGAGSVLDKLAAKAMPGEVPESVGLAGFSAFHNFANPFLKNAQDRARVCYVHLADACFDGVGAITGTIEPKQGYLAYALEAATGSDRLMVSTTSGVPGKAITYTYGGQTVTHAGGADSFALVWNEVLRQTGLSPYTPELPSDLPAAPVLAQRVGNLVWLRYDAVISHEDHANKLFAPVAQYFGVPWMVGEGRGAWWQGPAAMGVGAVAGYLLGRYLYPKVADKL